MGSEIGVMGPQVMGCWQPLEAMRQGIDSPPEHLQAASHLDFGSMLLIELGLPASRTVHKE